MLFCICYVSLDGRKLVSNKLVCLSQLEFRTCQLFMKHFNDCYGSPFYATHHIADGLTVLLCLHTIIRAAHRNPVSTFYYMMGTISGVLIELGDALVADFLVYGSRRRLQHYKFKYGGHFVNRRVTMSVHGQYAENKNAESLKAWKSRRNIQKPNLTKRSPFGFRRFFLGVFSSA